VGRWGVAEDATSWAGGVVVKVRSGDVAAVAAGIRVVGRARAATVRLPRTILVFSIWVSELEVFTEQEE